jgi:CheY-like chemotaxis protein
MTVAPAYATDYNLYCIIESRDKQAGSAELSTENRHMDAYTLSELTLDIRRALTHLYDWAYLLESPLLAALRRQSRINASTEPGAKELRQFLVESIEQLAPLDSLPSQSRPRRRYAALKARYIEQMTIAETADCLGLSERQVHRELQAGIRAMADIVYRDLFPEMHDGPWADVVDGARGLSAELESLSDKAGQVNLCTEVRNVAALTHRLAAVRQVDLHDEIRTQGLVVKANRIVLRQVLLALFTWGIRNASDGAVVYAVDKERGLATFELAFPDRQGSQPGDLTGSSPVAPGLLEALNADLHIERADDRIACSFGLPIASSCTLLLIDDNRGFHRLVRRYLAGQPYQLLSAYDAASGLALARTRTPDVIVLDVMVPDRDGWELVEVLRGDDVLRSIPIVICTVLDQRDLAQSLSVAGYMSKPLSQSVLLSTLQTLEHRQ